MTPSCYIRQGVAQFFGTLAQALADGPVLLEMAPLGDDLLGITHFADRHVILSPDLGADGLRSTVMHELVHLIRGPVTTEQAADEEAEVERIAAEMLVPDANILAGRAEPYQHGELQDLAARRAVDIETLHAALSPPTMPLRRVSRRAT